MRWRASLSAPLRPRTMPQRKRARIDRKALYVPRPDEWDFARLGAAEIARRLGAACATRERLQEWAHALEMERRDAQSALWSRLPEAKMAEASTRLGHIEDIGVQLTEVRRYLAQTERAIERI